MIGCLSFNTTISVENIQFILFPKNHKRSNSSSSQSFMSEKGTHIIAPLPMLLSMWYPLSLPSWNSSHSLLWCATSNVLICHHGPGDGVPKVHTENTTVGCFGTDNGFLLMKKVLLLLHNTLQILKKNRYSATKCFEVSQLYNYYVYIPWQSKTIVKMGLRKRPFLGLKGHLVVLGQAGSMGFR